MDWRDGDATGVYPYSRITDRPGDSAVEERDRNDVRRPRARRARCRSTCPHVTAALVHAMIDRARTFKASDLEGEKVASLGASPPGSRTS